MARLIRRVQKLFGGKRVPPTSTTAPEAETSTCRASEDGQDQAVVEPTCPPPRAIHQRHWQQGERIGLKRDGSGWVLAVILGSPGVGRRSVQNKLLYDDMDGGELLELSEHFMDEEIPAYLCGGYEYNLDVITSASNPMLDYSSGVGHDFFSVILAYDVHSQASFDEVSRLYDSICPRRNMGQPEINILVLGLKADLDSTDGRVPREAGESFAKERGCSFAECSARSGDGVYEAFGMVVEYAYSITMQFTGDFQGRISVINESRAHLRRAMERLRME